MDYQGVLAFWREAGPKAWWSKNDDFDEEIRAKFGKLHEQAANRGLEDWRKDACGALALTILLDQFSRNLYRGSPKAFENDGYCLTIVHGAMASGFDKAPEITDLRNFFYLPLMHSENIADQLSCIAAMHEFGEPRSLAAALEHYEIIARFGRFPHRNPVLGRHTTPAEQAFLEGGGFKG